MYSSITTGAVHGIDSYLIRVETDISDGLPSFNMVGFMSGEVREAGERVRVALKTAGFAMPGDRVLVNLAPSSIRKAGSGFDFAIAVGLLVATGQINPEFVRDALFVGELSLEGVVRPIKGMLAYA